MGWWGRKSLPEARPLVPAWLLGDAESGGFARGYTAQLDEVYRRNPVGLRAVRLVAGLVGGLPLFAGPSTGSGQAAVALVKAGGLLERAPPSDPAVGSCYLVGAGATGAWAGQDGSLACFSEGGWRFVVPADGLSLVDRVSGQQWLRYNGAWETGIVRAQEVRVAGETVVRNRQPAIEDPSAGAVVDSECRASVFQILAALRAHGLIG